MYTRNSSLNCQLANARIPAPLQTGKIPTVRSPAAPLHWLEQIHSALDAKPDPILIIGQCARATVSGQNAKAVHVHWDATQQRSEACIDDP
jgi:hypothetical protein